MATVQSTVQSVIDRYVAAVKASNADALISLYAADAHIFDMMEPFERHGLDAARTMIERWLGHEGATQQCEFEDLHMTESGDLASVRAAVRYGETLSDGTHHGVVTRATWTLQRIGDDWKIVTEHTSVPLSEKDMQPMYDAR